MFDLEDAIRQWQKMCRKNQGLEDGYIAELESHLRDAYSHNLTKGLENREAFDVAVQSLGTSDEIGSEFYKNDTTRLNGKPPWQKHKWMPDLLYNYYKITIRYIKRYLGFSIINIAGLALGITCCLVIFLHVKYELSFDDYHQDADRIFRVALDIQSSAGSQKYAVNSPPAAPTLKKDFPQVEYAGRILFFESNRMVKHQDKIFYENGFVYADQEIFDILTIPFLHGDKKSSLNRPRTVVLPERLALKYFNRSDAVDEKLTINGYDYVVTGVVKDSPKNTHIPFDLFVSIEDLFNPPWMEDWSWAGMFTYVKLMPNVDSDEFNTLITHFADDYYKGDPKTQGKKYQSFLQPIQEIYLHSNLIYDLVNGNPVYLYIFSAVGIFILLIACINFMNLSTARASKRAKEIGMRKVSGASRKQLIQQFLGESVLLSIVSFLVAIILLFGFKKLISDFLSLELNLENLFDFQTILLMLLLTVLVGVIAGFYPAIILSAFKPIHVMKGRTESQYSRSGLRKILVVGQFVISTTLIIGTLFVYNQIEYMRNKHLGFEKEQKLILPVRGRAPLENNFELVKNEFLINTSVSGVSVSGGVPGQGAGNLRTRLIGEEDPKFQMMHYMFFDTDFVPVYGIEIVAGRNFIKNKVSDVSEACLINQSAVYAFGWDSAEEALGKWVKTGLLSLQKEIIGVTNDFHYTGVQAGIDPLVMEIQPMLFGHITLSLNTTNFSKSIHEIEIIWNKLFPEQPFSHYFIDDAFTLSYQSEEQVGHLIFSLAILGIFIACLGLFALSSFITEQRTKEIGIRKVMGASTTSMVLLLSKEFTKWVLIGNLIAWPFAYWGVREWLKNFAYQTEIRVQLFVISGMIVLIIALLTVSFQAIKTAISNPVDSLKYE